MTGEVFQEFIKRALTEDNFTVRSENVYQFMSMNVGKAKFIYGDCMPTEKDFLDYTPDVKLYGIVSDGTLYFTREACGEHLELEQTCEKNVQSFSSLLDEKLENLKADILPKYYNTIIPDVSEEDAEEIKILARHIIFDRELVNGFSGEKGEHLKKYVGAGEHTKLWIFGDESSICYWTDLKKAVLEELSGFDTFENVVMNNLDANKGTYSIKRDNREGTYNNRKGIYEEAFKLAEDRSAVFTENEWKALEGLTYFAGKKVRVDVALTAISAYQRGTRVYEDLRIDADRLIKHVLDMESTPSWQFSGNTKFEHISHNISVLGIEFSDIRQLKSASGRVFYSSVEEVKEKSHDDFER
jgi:hypothetical protein